MREALKVEVYDNTDIDFLARLMRAEAIGEGEYGMLLVGNVVVNRLLCNSPDFEKITTLQEVIFQSPGGFAGVQSELFKLSSTPEEQALAQRVLDGEKFWPASRALWFYAPKNNEKCLTTWFNQQNIGQYKSHCFYVPEEGQC
ncbi:MAG: cell wall hydrolase [Bacilli bacterium]|nr:cell wall hydrolase [Bacilli bacterium]